MNMDANARRGRPRASEAARRGQGRHGDEDLGEGKIADRREESLKYVLGLDCVDAIVIGFESPAQIDEIIGMASRAGGTSNE